MRVQEKGSGFVVILNDEYCENVNIQIDLIEKWENFKVLDINWAMLDLIIVNLEKCNVWVN